MWSKMDSLNYGCVRIMKQDRALQFTKLPAKVITLYMFHILIVVLGNMNTSPLQY